MYSSSETIARVSGLTAERLEFCIEQGLVYTSIGHSGPVFGEIDVARLRLICTLQDEMDVDDDMLPSILSLLDHVYNLRRGLRMVARAIASEPKDIRLRILERLR